MDVYELINSKRGEIHALAKRFGAKNIRIIGSVARHEAHDKSDIDLLVEFAPTVSLLSHAAFQRELTMILGREVDVASVHGLKDKVRPSVLKDAIPL
ncbi:MAG: nucleotidyltransferase family protein [Methanoregula sp.]|jgi:hypothetical protein